MSVYPSRMLDTCLNSLIFCFRKTHEHGFPIKTKYHEIKNGKYYGYYEE